MMKVEYINPFVLASFSVLETVLGHKPNKGQLAVQPCSFTSQQLNVVCGVSGQVAGQVIYGMSLSTADRIASAMLGAPIKIFDQLAASAIAELGNMISGNAMLLLSEQDIICDITPPTMIRGTKIEINTLSIPAIVLPLETEHGEMFITIGLQIRK